MANNPEQKILRRRKILFYWIAFAFSYIFPFVYFLIKLGITRSTTKIVLPVLIVGVFAVLKLASDLPKWVSTWEPSIWKGLVKATPKFLLFIVLITLGLALKYIIERQVQLAFATYFETVIVLFGGMSVGSIFEAYHLYYKEQYLISKGYVLGVVNNT